MGADGEDKWGYREQGYSWGGGGGGGAGGVTGDKGQGIAVFSSEDSLRRVYWIRSHGGTGRGRDREDRWGGILHLSRDLGDPCIHCNPGTALREH